MTSTKKLKDIASGQQNCKILGRLTRLWDSRNMRSKSADSLINIDGIIIDENGEMVQITVPRKLEKQFRPLLAQGQGSLHVFTDLSAIDIKQRTYIYHHQKYMLQFQPTSKVHRLESQRADIANYAFNFCPFDQLSSKDITSKPLLELIGVISHIGPHDYASATSRTKLRKIKIQNLEYEETQEVQLWGKNGEEFDEAAVLEKSKTGIVVAIFAGLTAGSFKGIIQASSTSATQIFISSDIPDIAKFHESYKWEAPTLQQHVPKLIQLSPIEAAGKIYNVNQISELQTSSFQGGATYSCIAKISAIVPSTKWYYKVCRTCKVGYSSISEEPRCDCPPTQPMPMYKLPITITDDTGSIDAIAFSLIAEELVERSAYHASQNMKIDATEHVVALQKAIGKTRLFQIGMATNFSSSFSINYVLRKCFEINNSSTSSQVQNSSTTSQATPIMPALPSPQQSTTSESSKAKRTLDFNEDKECNEDKQQNASETLPKRPRPELADNNTTEDTSASGQSILPNNKI